MNSFLFFIYVVCCVCASFLGSNVQCSLFCCVCSRLVRTSPWFKHFLVQEVRFVLLLTIYSTLLNVRTMNYDFLLYFLNFLNSMSYGTVHAYLPYHTVIIFITVYLYPTYGLYGTVPYPPPLVGVIQSPIPVTS